MGSARVRCLLKESRFEKVEDDSHLQGANGYASHGHAPEERVDWEASVEEPPEDFAKPSARGISNDSWCGELRAAACAGRDKDEMQAAMRRRNTVMEDTRPGGKNMFESAGPVVQHDDAAKHSDTVASVQGKF